MVRQRGYVTIAAMAARFDVSAQTIRRDIQALSDQRLLERHHGGAGLAPGTDTLAYTSRRVRNAAPKRAIGNLVAHHIPDHATVFIDIGTTTEAVAIALQSHRGLRVVTNHLRVASVLSERTDFEVTLAGGVVRRRDQAVTGAATAEFLRQFRFAYGIFGIGTIGDDGALLDYDYRDVQVSRVALEGSRHRFVVMDRSKVGADAMVRLCHLDDVHALFMDAPPPPPLADTLARSAVELHTARPATRAAGIR
ncbi:MAG: DeoR/GlpR transcriptional regulator [Ectothiorhodospiraceae bacterium]|nr:DeoR/GlpR transcriptional regulator [Ectothiorhodospiraceae bacterium]